MIDESTTQSPRQIAELVADELIADLAARRIDKIDDAVIRDRLAQQDGRRVRHDFNALVLAVAMRVVEVGP